MLLCYDCFSGFRLRLRLRSASMMQRFGRKKSLFILGADRFRSINIIKKRDRIGSDRIILDRLPLSCFLLTIH
jgi:hypothetical protein